MRSRSRRSGAALVTAMVCLLVSVSIVSTMIAGTLHRRVQLRSLHRVRQAEVLVTTARDRALRKLQIDASYGGEEWAPIVAEAPQKSIARVAIEVKKDDQGRRRIEVSVVFPSNRPNSVRRSGLFPITASKDNQSTKEEDPQDAL